MPLMDMAAVLGWHITIVDGRPSYATRQRFGKAHQVIVAKPEAVVPQLFIDGQTVFVLMTHNYHYDKAMLQQLIGRDTAYIGILGPRKKLLLLLEELQHEGHSVSDELLLKVFGPVGLDLKAETAEEIALSVTAEIKAVLSGGSGTFLRDKQQPIHHHAAEAITHVSLPETQG